MKLIWTEVETGMNRAEVPGGWIVQQYDQKHNERQGRWEWVLISAFFVPDALHTWCTAADAEIAGVKNQNTESESEAGK
jgi:hypothetical protein